MAYIYKIVNDINNKVYIGKTEETLHKRFQEHIRDSRKSYRNDRPLYRAMNKYGIEHFHIELIEETDKPEEREIYWIEQERSFKYGYNATRGGDGRKYLDYDLIIETYKQMNYNQLETAKALNINVDTVHKVVLANNLPIKKGHEHTSKVINQYDLESNYIQTFASISEAERSLGKLRARQHIAEVCDGKRKTAYGYIWRYADLNNN